MRQQVNIDDIQFGFMPGCGNTNVIFILGHSQKQLTKILIRYLRILHALRELDLEKWLVEIVQSVFRNT